MVFFIIFYQIKSIIGWDDFIVQIFSMKIREMTNVSWIKSSKTNFQVAEGIEIDHMRLNMSPKVDTNLKFYVYWKIFLLGHTVAQILGHPVKNFYLRIGWLDTFWRLIQNLRYLASIVSEIKGVPKCEP